MRFSVLFFPESVKYSLSYAAQVKFLFTQSSHIFNDHAVCHTLFYYSGISIFRARLERGNRKHESQSLLNCFAKGAEDLNNRGVPVSEGSKNGDFTESLNVIALNNYTEFLIQSL